MVDNLASTVRSKVMSSIKGKDTRPELEIRKLVWASGKRYRVHDRSVFGIPDMSNKSRNLAVFIDGCFWHGCRRCYKQPTTNVSYWKDKIDSNRQRRKGVLKKLRVDGWVVLQFWEHDVLANPTKLSKIICRKL